MSQEDQDERGFFSERPQPPPGKPQPPGKRSAKLEEKPHYLGHRQRLRDRFREQGPSSLADYELLELLLFRSIPRADTKEAAKALLKRFGSFAEVLGAPEHLLREVTGVGEGAARDLKAIAAAASRMAKAEVVARPVLSSWAQVIEYCRAAMAFEPREQFRGLMYQKHHLSARPLERVPIESGACRE